jgi:hypothetical protein
MELLFIWWLTLISDFVEIIKLLNESCECVCVCVFVQIVSSDFVV